MAITVLRKSSPRPVPGGQEGTYEQIFNCAWSTTDVTGTIPSGLRKVVFMGPPMYLQEPAEGETIYHAGSVNADGSIVLASGDVILMGRVSFAPTSGLKFSIRIEGYR